MVEKINNNKGATHSEYEDSMSDAPKFDKEAARMARVEAYKEAHPDAVEDIEKARAMAEAGDRLETMAVDRLNDAKDLMAKKGNSFYENTSRPAPVKNEDGDIIGLIGVDPRGDEFVQRFDAPEGRIPNALTAAREALKYATEEETKAGERYDEIKKIQNLSIDDLRKSIEDN